MLRICYTSQATDAGNPGQLLAITEASWELNRLAGITGLLLFDGRRFLQALEGPDAAVADCYGRIARDERHFDIRVIFNTAIARREFGDWSMRRRLLDQTRREAFRQTVMGDVAGVSDMHLRAFFVGFAALGEQ
ncbi:BLUF domain-containing protein [Sphingomonas solaris]|uniref:BLUF domain-containing protein n=1 Tax=Alterirhizorhabdus solaris TaxID=2529389 RepID=A0A558QZH3_9SPHN|nr:BLUF domain-containing protein [Sphingomonas solaris]TVV72556.1 BLUF domain-containing protein [Sphingomonas solaris]